MSMRNFQRTNKRGDPRSNFEFKILRFLKTRGVDFKYEGETLPYIKPESKHKYLPDFTMASGIIIEAKGKFSSDDRKKMLLVKEQHPDRDIRMLFMRNNKISKNSKTSYTDWCDKYGIIHHVDSSGKVPDDWLT